jgi:hypothetical protein
MMLWDRIRERKPIQNGLRRAGIHLAKAAYEVVGGIGAFAEEIVAVVRDDSDDDHRSSGPTRIPVD